MILDAFAQFTGFTAATGTATGNSDGTDSPTTGTQQSSGIIDLHIAAPPGVPVLANNQGARDMGIGDDPALKLNIQVTVAFTNATNMAVNLQGATDNGSGAPASFVTMLSGATVTEANLIAGAQLLPVDMPRPPQGVAIPRFLQIQYVTSGTHNTGKVRGNIVLDRFDQPYFATNDAVLSGYPSGITVPN